MSSEEVTTRRSYSARPPQPLGHPSPEGECRMSSSQPKILHFGLESAADMSILNNNPLSFLHHDILSIQDQQDFSRYETK